MRAITRPLRQLQATAVQVALLDGTIEDDLAEAGVEAVRLLDGEIACDPADVVEWLIPRAADVLDRALVAAAAHCTWPPQPTAAPSTYDRWDAVELLAGIRTVS